MHASVAVRCVWQFALVEAGCLRDMLDRVPANLQDRPFLGDVEAV